MRNVILLDTKIDKDEALLLLDDYADFIEKHSGVKPVFWVERHDFSSVPTEPDGDGDLKPTWEYRQKLANSVFSRYSTYGTDNIVMWVHEDNFLYKGIWGVNYSYAHHKYCFQLCRWDKDNPANTFGTLYHEQMHSFDAVIKYETGFNVDTLITGHWDTAVVHGQGAKWEYIGRRTGRENTAALELIAPHLRKAYQNRLDKHFKPVREVQKRLITQLRLVVDRLLGRIKVL